MDTYYLNKKTNEYGFHMVHKINCVLMVGEDNRIQLGEFPNGLDAVHVAKRYFPKSTCCLFCAVEQ